MNELLYCNVFYMNVYSTIGLFRPLYKINQISSIRSINTTTGGTVQCTNVHFSIIGSKRFPVGYITEGKTLYLKLNSEAVEDCRCFHIFHSLVISEISEFFGCRFREEK